MQGDEFKVEVINWDKYNGSKKGSPGRPTKRAKRYWWLCFDNTFFDHPDALKVDPETITMWLFILCECSKSDSNSIQISHLFAGYRTQLSTEKQKNALTKLHKIGWLTYFRSKNKTELSALQYSTEQDNTEQNRTGPPPPPRGNSAPKSHWLIDLWNENCGPLPKVRDASEKRVKACEARVKEIPDKETWNEGMKRTVASAFCTGSTGWRASFDWFTRKGTLSKILEGNYDDGPRRTSKAEGLVNNAREQLAMIDRGEI